MGKITYTPSTANFVNGNTLQGENLNDKINNKDNVIAGIVEGLSAYYEKTNNPDKTISSSDTSVVVAPIIRDALSGIIYDYKNNRGIKINNSGITFDLKSGDNFKITNLPLVSEPTTENLLCIDGNGIIKKIDLEQASPADPSSTSDTSVTFISSITQDTYGKIHATKKYIMALKDVSYDASTNKLILTDAIGHTYDHITIGDNYTPKCFYNIVFELQYNDNTTHYIYLNLIDTPLDIPNPDAFDLVTHIAKYNDVFIGVVIDVATGCPIGNKIKISYQLDEEGEPSNYYIQFFDFNNNVSQAYMYNAAYEYILTNLATDILIEKQS